MIVQTSKQTVDWSLLENSKNVMVKVSGGLDSAIVLYMLCDYITKTKKDISVIVVTTNDWRKPYQVKWAAKVRAWMINAFPNINFLPHETHQLNTGEDYVEGQRTHHNQVREKYSNDGHPVDFTLSGINMRPPSDVVFLESNGKEHAGPTDDRTSVQPISGNEWFKPILNMDKKEIAELYEQFDLLDTLFYETRSCEEPSKEITKDFITHCGECWWCQERKWGFGKI
jgi:hypothetical protein